MVRYGVFMKLRLCRLTGEANMASSVGAQYASGSTKANNSTLSIRTVGFVPRRVVIWNETNQCHCLWFEQLAAAAAYVVVAAGDLSVVSSAGVTALTADSSGNVGFSVGALANINDTTTEVLRWEAWG